MLFTSILTGCLGPSGGVSATAQMCGPDVSAWVWKMPGAAPWSKWAGLLAAGLSSGLGLRWSAMMDPVCWGKREAGARRDS